MNRRSPTAPAPSSDSRNREQLLLELAEKEHNLRQMAADAHELIRTQANLQGLLHSACEAFIVLNAEGYIQSVNKAGESIFGYPEIELMQQRPDKLFQIPQDFNDVPSFIRSISNAHSSEPVFGVKRNGEIVPLYATFSEVVSQDLVLFSDNEINDSAAKKDYELFCIILRDLTQELRMQQELSNKHEELRSAYLKLSNANKLQSEFIANISHELRTPLNGILGLGELLKQSPLNEEQQQFADAICKSGENLFTLLDNLLEFSNLHDEQGIPVKIPVDLEDCIRKLKKEFTSRAQDKGLKINFLPLQQSGRFLTSPLYLQKIFFNLLDNAIKYSNSGSICAEWTLDESSNVVQLRVSDQGIGIEANKLANIFDPFYQIDGSITRSQGGIGMGLTVAHEMARLLDGDIQVTSELGKGSEFRIQIPIEWEDANPDDRHDNELQQQLSKFQEMLGDALVAFIESFLAETREKMEQLNLAYFNQKYADAVTICDSLNTACTTIGVKRLATAISDLRDSLSRNQQHQQLKDSVDLLYTELRDTLIEIVKTQQQ